MNGRVGGTAGPASGNEGDLYPFGHYSGDIAMLRFWEDEAILASEVQSSYTAITGIPAPEPGTGLLLGLGLVLLGAARSRG